MNILSKIVRLLNPVSPLRRILPYRTLWKNLIKRKLTQNYRNSLFGWIWNVIQPLFMLLVYTYVFREVFRVRWGIANDSDQAFAVTMFCGLIFFNVFSETLNLSATVMENHVNFVKKTVFPLELLPLTQCAASSVTGGICFLIVFAANVLISGTAAFSWSLLVFPVIFFSFILFAAGLSMVTASLGVYFKDTRFLCTMMLQVLFFITPIFYPASAVPLRYRWILEINPLSWFVDAGRGALLNGTLPSPLTLGILLGTGLVAGQLGWGFFSATGKGFADVL
ncbi:MAG: ABC transporter permease [Lentisphaeria bacterium]|nr:ABC transporter permease [Lentisphaeria bacterium]